MPYRLPPAQTNHLDKPILVWDGQCGFCKYWVTRWRKMTDGKVTYAPYQEAAGQFSAIPESEFRRAAYLIEPDGKTFRGMEAAYRTFTYGERWGFLYDWYAGSRLFRGLNDRLYKWIAHNRPFFYSVTKALWGKDPERMKPYWLFYLLALLALIVAFE